MDTPPHAPDMPVEMLQKLRAVQRHARRVRLQTGLLRAAAVFLAAMLAALVIDWIAAFHDGPWRWLLTLGAFGCAAAAFLLTTLSHFLRPPSLAAIARDVDRAHPSLQERCQTLAEFAQSNDNPDLRGSPAMIRKVAEQTAALSGGIAPDAVVSKSALRCAGKFLGAALAVLALFFILDFPRAKVLCERFLAPGADLSLTRVHSKTGDIVIGKGEDVKLEILADGFVPLSATVSLRSADGKDDSVDIQRETTAKTVDHALFTYTARDVEDSFAYRVQSGDGRTPWHHVTVLERPKLAQVQLRIIAPAYSHLPLVEEKTLPRQIRALEGSRMEVSFQADQPLSSMDLKFSDGKIQHLTESAGHRYHFDTLLTNSLAFEPVLTNTHHLDNQARPNCEIVVYPDEPPTVTVSSPDDQITARPDDKLKINFEARDDFGLMKAELVVNVKSDTGSNAPPVVIPIPLEEKEVGSRLIKKEVDLDLAKFNLKQDQELTYTVRVTDSKNGFGASTPPPETAANKSAQNQTPANNNASTRNSQNTAQNNTTPPNTKPSDPRNPSSPQEAKNQQANNTPAQSHIPMPAAKPSNASPPPPGASQPPPNPMMLRALDVGQCSSCQPMRVIVDEWARSFDGQMRDKQELAIDPTMKLLDEVLRRAHDLTESSLAAARSPQGLSQNQSPALEDDKDQLRQAGRAISELRKVSAGTPYAFISLQLSDIGDTHVTPARQELGEVTLETAGAKNDRDNLEQASAHIIAARAMLANLTKTYESVKRDNQIADAMQELKKMHQIFLEDTQAMLGNKKPVLNPVDRKVAEVDDAYADKLAKLAEEKKKIMAELAKILANDPRMLRRFMALEELDGTSLRDQTTLLARRQQALAKQTAQWAVADEKERPALAAQDLAAQSAEQSDVSSLAGKLHENMITWLPDGVSQDQEPAATALNIAAQGARLAAEASSQTSPDTLTNALAAARRALDQFRLLHDYLPEMSQGADGKDLSVFSANRLNEADELITRQSGWIKKIEALRAGDFPQAAEVDQHSLTLDTTTLSEKLDASIPSWGSLSPEIKAKGGELTHTVEKQIIPEESRAGDALFRKTVKDAVSRQDGATAGFARAETQFDELLHMIVAKLDASPAPTDPGSNQTLEEMLAMLKDEKKAAEGLGIPQRPLNIQVMKDWLKSNNSQNPGAGGRQAMARAAQQQARDAARRAARLSDQAKQALLVRSSELAAKSAAGAEGGPKHPANAWNTIASQLGDDLRQGRDTVPPEQYRQAIEQYFNTISETLPATPAARENNP